MATNVYRGRAPNEAIRYTFTGFEKRMIPDELFKLLKREYDSCNKNQKWTHGTTLAYP